MIKINDIPSLTASVEVTVFGLILASEANKDVCCPLRESGNGRDPLLKSTFGSVLGRRFFIFLRRLFGDLADSTGLAHCSGGVVVGRTDLHDYRSQRYHRICVRFDPHGALSAINDGSTAIHGRGSADRPATFVYKFGGKALKREIRPMFPIRFYGGPQ